MALRPKSVQHYFDGTVLSQNVMNLLGTDPCRHDLSSPPQISANVSKNIRRVLLGIALECICALNRLVTISTRSMHSMVLPYNYWCGLRI